MENFHCPVENQPLMHLPNPEHACSPVGLYFRINITSGPYPPKLTAFDIPGSALVMALKIGLWAIYLQNGLLERKTLKSASCEFHLRLQYIVSLCQSAPSHVS